MGNYLLSKKAIEDLSGIWDYTYETWSEHQADLYYSKILTACQKLANGLIKGKPYKEVSAEILGYKIGRHLIFYRISKSNTIEIARILHGQMDLKNRISGE